MITIGKIREKSGLLIGVIGGALLLFILGEAIRSWGGPASNVPPRGEAYGEPLDDQKINEFTELYIRNSQQNAAQQGKEFTDQDRTQAENSAYNEVLRLTLLGKEFEALGIAASEEEIDAFIFGTDSAKRSATVERFFPSPDGGFDEEQFNDFITQAENNVVSESGFNFKEFYEKDIRGQIRSEREADKYVALLQYGTYVTSFEAEQDYQAANEKISVSFVQRQFDYTDFEISDKQFEDFYNDNKNHPKYKQKDTREYTYTYLDIKPSEDDKKLIIAELADKKAAFASTTNDSTFVLSMSDNKFFNRSQAYSVATQEGAPNSYPESVDAEMQSANIGDIVGPYSNGDKVELSKVLGFQSEKQSWVRHILISASDEPSFVKAQKKADSIVGVIKVKNNFVEMVTLFSEDPGSKSTGGEYKWFPEGQMVPEFNDYSFQEPLNKLGTVKTTYGIHIIEVLGRREAKKPLLAVITKNVVPSESTISNAELDARDLWSELEGSGEEFDSLATLKGFSIQPGSAFLENPQLYGFSPSAQSQALNFLFKPSTPVYSVSDPIRDNNRFVIIQLTNVINEGAPDLETAKKVMESDAKKHYLSELYAKDMNSTDLNALASKFGLKVETAEVNFKAGTIGQTGTDLIVVGALFSALKKGTITVPIKGNRGVYVLRVDNIAFDKKEDGFDEERKTQFETISGSVSTKAFVALTKYADHKDNRNRLKVGAY